MDNDLNVPSYAELAQRTDAPAGSSWHVFGQGDQIGTLHFLTPERIVEASRLVTQGKVFNLDYDLNAFDPNQVKARQPVTHHMFQANPNHRDDWIDSFYLQGTSQIDGLRHMRHPVHGFYGGVADEAVVEGTPDLGIGLVAERGIVGRGILLDAVAYFEHVGRPLHPRETYRITPEDLEAIAAHQGTEIRKGDILLFRVGWSRYYTGLTVDERINLTRAGQPGLIQSYEMLAWLWDNQISVIASDNGGVEAGPIPQEPFWDPEEVVPPSGSTHNGMMHRPLIALLGFYLGELWFLEDLAADCAADGIYEFLLTAKPINLVGGVGSPPNALAIK